MRRLSTLIAGRSASEFGDATLAVAAPLLIIANGGGAELVGLSAAASFVAQLLGNVLIGSFKRLPDLRRVILSAEICSALLAGVSVLWVVALVSDGIATAYLIILIVMAMGFFSALNSVAFYAALPAVLPASILDRANARLSVWLEVFYSLGILLSALLLRVGPVAVLSAIAMSHLLATLMKSRALPTALVGSRVDASAKPALFSAACYVWRSDSLRPFVLAEGLATLGTGSAGVLAVLLFTQRFDVSASDTALFLLIPAIASVIAGLVMPQVVGRLVRGKAWLVTLSLQGASLLALAFCFNLMVASALFFLSSLFGALANLIATVIRQAETSQKVRGTALAFMSTVVLVSASISSSLSGYAVSKFALSSTYVGCVLLIAAAISLHVVVSRITVRRS